MTMGKYFGTDGFRGEANVDLTVEHAYKAVSYTHLDVYKRQILYRTRQSFIKSNELYDISYSCSIYMSSN